MYKAVLQNDLLQDPDEGVNYFKNTLKKFFLKRSTNVYLYRLLSFFNHRRQRSAEGPESDTVLAASPPESPFSQSCCQRRIAPLNPAPSTGLLHSILHRAQDCSTQSCADDRIAPMQHQQLGLETVLARAQAHNGVGPAVELPGLWHVVDAQDEGGAIWGSAGRSRSFLG